MIEKDFHRVERGMVFWYSPQTAYHTDILIKDGKRALPEATYSRTTDHGWW